MSFLLNPYIHAPVGSGFTPADVAGLLHWADFSNISRLFQDAAQSTSVASDGDPIGGVNDLSAANADGSQATSGDRPTYKTNIINSLSVARGDGTSDNLAASVNANGLAGVSVYGVIRTGASVAVSAKGVFSWADTKLSGTPFLILQLNSSDLRVYCDGGYRLNAAVAANTVYQFAVRWSGTIWYLRLNGSETSTAASNSNASTADEIFYFSGFNGYSDVDFGESAVYNSFVTGTDDTDIEDYLRTKWAAY